MHEFSTAAVKSSVLPARLAKAGTPDPQAGAPGLLNVPYSTFAGADPQKRVPSRVAQRTKAGAFTPFETRTYA